jgi:hypothetical protein
MDQYKHSICLVTCCFGQQLPQWAGYFFKTAGWNSTVDFVVFTDCEAPAGLAPNIKFVQMGLQAFNVLASQQLGVHISVGNPDKLNDFRPAFGRIFAEYIDKYEFWGHVSTDVLLGNLREFLTDELLAQTDCFTVREDYPAGYCSLYRNVEAVNDLFMQSKDWKHVFANPAYAGFDETGLTYNAYLKRKVLRPNVDAIVAMDDVFNYSSDGLRIQKQTVSSELGSRDLFEVNSSGIQVVGKEDRFMVISFKCLSVREGYTYPPILSNDSNVYVDIFGMIPCPADRKLTTAERNEQLLNMRFAINYHKVRIQPNDEILINTGVNEWFEISKYVLINTQVMLLVHHEKQVTGHEIVDFFIKSKLFTIQKKVPPNKTETGVILLNIISRLAEFGHFVVKQ